MAHDGPIAADPRQILAPLKPRRLPSTARRSCRRSRSPASVRQVEISIRANAAPSIIIGSGRGLVVVHAADSQERSKIPQGRCEPVEVVRSRVGVGSGRLGRAARGR